MASAKPLNYAGANIYIRVQCYNREALQASHLKLGHPNQGSRRYNHPESYLRLNKNQLKQAKLNVRISQDHKNDKFPKMLEAWASEQGELSANRQYREVNRRNPWKPRRNPWGQNQQTSRPGRGYNAGQIAASILSVFG